MAANSLDHFVQRTISWTIAFGVIVLGLATVLAASGVAWGVVLAWMALAVGVFAGMEPGIVAWAWVLTVSRGAEEVPPKAAPAEGPSPAASPTGGEEMAGDRETSEPIVEPSPELKFDWHYKELGDNPTNPARQAIEITAILVLAVLAFLGSRILQGAPPFTPHQSDEQKVLDELRSDLKKCLDRACGQAPVSPPGPNQVGPIKLDPEFQQQLLDLLKQSVQSNANSNTGSWLGPGIVVLLVIVTAIVVIVLAMKKGPEAASPIGAVGLAAIVLKKVDHFSELNESTYWWTLLAFLALVGLFVFLASRLMKREDNALAAAATAGVAPAAAARAGKKEKEDSPLSILFSLAVLVWLVLFVCYRPQAVQNPDQHPKSVTKASYDRFDPISGFNPGSTSLPKNDLKDRIEKLAQDVAKETKQGDMLLFLGSADCTAVHTFQCPSTCKAGCSSNKDLAKCRAQVVAEAFPPGNAFTPGQIMSDSLYQHEGCTKSDDLRAVFPVLIHAEQ